MDNLVRSVSRNDMTQVIVNTELVVEDDVFLTVDEERFVEKVQRTTEAMWRRIPENHYRGLTRNEVSSPSFRP